MSRTKKVMKFAELVYETASSFGRDLFGGKHPKREWNDLSRNEKEMVCGLILRCRKYVSENGDGTPLKAQTYDIWKSILMSKKWRAARQFDRKKKTTPLIRDEFYSLPASYQSKFSVITSISLLWELE